MSDGEPFSSSARFFKSTPGLLLLAMTAIACLRFYNAAGNDLWQDEIVCAYKAQDGFSRTIEILRNENQPPLYHFVLNIWSGIFGDSACDLRSISIICGLIMQLLIFAVARQVCNISTAWWALLISGCSVALLEFTQEATPYALFWLFCLFGSHQFIRCWMKPKNPAGWVLYTLARTAAIYTHYFGIFLLCVEGFGCLVHLRSRGKFFISWCISLAAIVILFLPWLPVFIEQQRRVSGEFWVPAISPGSIINAFRQWTLWIPELDHRPWILATLLICQVYFALLISAAYKIFMNARTRSGGEDVDESTAHNTSTINTRLMFILLCYVAIPILAVAVLSLKRSLFTPKYLLICAPYYYILVAYGIRTFPSRRLGNIGGGLILIVSFFFCLMNQSHPGYLNPQYRDAARYIRFGWHADDLVLTGDSQSLVALDRQLRDLQTKVYWWNYSRTEIPFWQGLRGYPPELFVEDISGLLANRPRVWLILPIPNYKNWESNYVQNPTPKPTPLVLHEAGYVRSRYQYFNGIEIYLYTDEQKNTNRF